MTIVQMISTAASLAVIVGIGIGLFQLRLLRRARQEEIVLRAYGPFLDPAFSRAFWTVQSWSYATYEDFVKNATLEDQVTFDIVAIQFEMMGVLYHRGLAPLDLLDDLIAEPTIMAWNRIAPIIYGYREANTAPGWSRWHEALAVALDKRMTERGKPHVALIRPQG